MRRVGPGAIRFEGVRFGYGGAGDVGRAGDVVRGLSLDVAGGSTVALVGVRENGGREREWMAGERMAGECH